LIQCTKCDVSLPVELLNAPGLSACPQCGALIRVDAFPALVNQPASTQEGEKLVMDSEAGCFSHPRKKAVVPCASCGRFLCALCDVEIGGRHLCPLCLETGKKKRTIKNLENHRVLYDNGALSLSVLPLILVWVTIITAPMSLYYAIRPRNTPTSILPRTKVRFIIAIIFSLLQIGGWALLFTKWLT
jgi:hypothetical protein